MKIAIIATDNREHHRKYGITSPYFGTAPEALIQGFSMLENPNLEVHVLSCTQQRMSSPEKLAANIWFHSLHVPKIGWLRTGYQGCIRAVRHKIHEIDPDIVHGQGTERDCALSVIFSGFPNVLTIHGNMRSVARTLNARIGSFHWIAGKLEQFALSRSDGIFCNSSYTRKMVWKSARQTWLVPNPVRSQFFEKQRIAKKNQHPIFLNIGTISPIKQQIKLITLMKNLRVKNFKFEMIFAGPADAGSSYALKFLKEINSIKHEGYIRYIGNLGINEIIDEMDKASALVHVAAEESFGLVVAEALARNLKLFAFATGGVSDVAAGSKSANLVETNDWKSLDSMIQIWMKEGFEMPLLEEELILKYHPRVIAEKHLEIYQEILNK